MLLAGCGYPERHLELYYVRGMTRREVLRRDPDPVESRRLNRSIPDDRVAGFLQEIEIETGQRPASYDFYVRILSSFGSWGDYVFYDEDGLLLGARRVPLD